MATKQKRNRHWMVWPDGATEWMLTYSREFAETCRKNGWGCIEFVEVKRGA